MAYLIAKHGGAFFRGNAKAIAASIHQATAEKARQADSELSEVNAKISRLDQELAEMRETARQGGIAEAERLRVSGNAEIEKNQAGGPRGAGSLRTRRAAATAGSGGIHGGGAGRSAGEFQDEPGSSRKIIPRLPERAGKERQLKALAERYAAALVDVALENKQADQVKQELAAFAAMVRESDDLHAFLSNPSIARAIKHSAIEQLVARMGASRTLRNYLFVIVDQRRAGMLIEIEQAFSALLDARQGITQATVTSAADLTPGERAELDAALAKLTGRKGSGAIQDGCGADRRRGGANRFDDL